GLALNLIYGPRPSHYGIAILGAVAGGIISAQQVLVYIVPDSGSYGNAIFGLHLYPGALLMFALIVVGSAFMLLFDRQFAPTEPLGARPTLLPVTAIALLLLLAVGNVVSTLAICGLGVACPEKPSGYLIFNDNLSVTLLGKPS
ncbi:MAG: disulfide bond formation protein B, partial [Methyloceanibacter sp.]